MSTKVREAKLKSEFHKNALAFYRSHPEVPVCDANNLALERQMDLMLLPPTPESFERAYEAIKGQLAKVVTPLSPEELKEREEKQVFAEAQKIVEKARQQQEHEAMVAERKSPRFGSAYWTTERIKKYIREHAPETIPGSLEARIQEAELPPEMTREYLIHLPVEELRRLKRVHGLQRILDRIDGRDGK